MSTLSTGAVKESGDPVRTSCQFFLVFFIRVCDGKLFQGLFSLDNDFLSRVNGHLDKENEDTNRLVLNGQCNISCT